MVVIAVIALVAEALITALEKRLLRWRPPSWPGCRPDRPSDPATPASPTNRSTPCRNVSSSVSAEGHPRGDGRPRGGDGHGRLCRQRVQRRHDVHAGAAAGSGREPAPLRSRSWWAACRSRSTCPTCSTKQLGYYDKAGVNVKLIDEPAGGDATPEHDRRPGPGRGRLLRPQHRPPRRRASPRSPWSRCCRSPGRSSCAAATSRARSSRPPTGRDARSGITDTGSSTDFLTQYLATKNGVNPAKTTRRGVGAGPRSSPR